MDEASGNPVDSSGNGRTGQSVGSIQYAQSGSVGTAFRFDGNSYIKFARPVSNDFSIMYWVKPDETFGSGGHWWAGKGLVDAEVAGVVNDFGTSFLNNRIAFGTGSSSPNFDETIESPTTINVGQWYHVAVTRSKASGEMKIYINGFLEKTDIGSVASLTSPSEMRIAMLQTGQNGGFKGFIDDVLIYDRVLTDSEIATYHGTFRPA